MSKQSKTLRSLLTTSLALCCAFSFVNAAHSKDNSKNKLPANVFSAPPEMNEIPIYVKNDGTPLTPRAADNIDNGDLDLVSKLPSLTNDQRKAINKIIQEGRNEMNSIRAGVKKWQDELKAAQPVKTGKITGVKDHSINIASATPDNSSSMMQEESLGIEEPTPDELKALIQTGNDRIKEKNVAVWQAVIAKLTFDQKGDLDKMKQGRLIISTSASLPADQALDTTYGEVNDSGLNKALVKRAMSTVTKKSLYESIRGN